MLIVQAMPHGPYRDPFLSRAGLENLPRARFRGAGDLLLCLLDPGSDVERAAEWKFRHGLIEGGRPTVHTGRPRGSIDGRRASRSRSPATARLRWEMRAARWPPPSRSVRCSQSTRPVRRRAPGARSPSDCSPMRRNSPPRCSSIAISSIPRPSASGCAAGWRRPSSTTTRAASGDRLAADPFRSRPATRACCAGGRPAAPKAAPPASGAGSRRRESACPSAVTSERPAAHPSPQPYYREAWAYGGIPRVARGALSRPGRARTQGHRLHHRRLHGRCAPAAPSG